MLRAAATTHAYDKANRRTKTTYAITPPDTVALSESWEYDGAGRRTAWIDTAGKRTEYAYDGAEGEVTTFGYDAAGNRTSAILPNGTTTAWTYDARGRITKIEHRRTANNALVGSYAYLWNAQGLRSREDSILTAFTYGCRADYTYDALGRLTKVVVINGAVGGNPCQQPLGTWSYTYDAVGNRLTETSTAFPAGTGTYTYDALDRLTKIEGKKASTYTYDASGNYEMKARQADPGKMPVRLHRDRVLCGEIRRVYEENLEVYGARKVWRQLNREDIEVARCTVERLMRSLGLQGAVRGGKRRTTIADDRAELPLDLVNRCFEAERPNQLWIADFTYVATWSGFVYVAFVIDVFARRIIGWRVARSMRGELVLDALEQAIWARSDAKGVIHHSDRGSQYVSIRYSERSAEFGAQPSVGSVGDSYDNALAETMIGLFKAEVIHRRGPWRGLDDVEYATLEWVDWFNNGRLLEPLGYLPPAEFEARYHQSAGRLPMGA